LLDDLSDYTSMTDLTGGFGVDAVMMGRRFQKLIFVEKNPDLCRIAQNNLPLLGIDHAEIHHEDAVEFIEKLPHQSLIYVDPARRDNYGRKTIAVSDCSPDVVQLNQLLLAKASTVLIKLSPMLHLSSLVQSLKGLSSIHIVSVQGECKEILAVLHPDATTPVQWTCVNTGIEKPQIFNFTLDSEKSASSSFAVSVGRFIYEPNASIMKAGCFKSVAQEYGLQIFHPNSHLYTSDNLVPQFPGRIFCFEQLFTTNREGLKQLRLLGQANITVRNYPMNVAQLRQRLHLSEGGNHYILATTLADNRKVLLLTTRWG